uniref:Putative secreted protein n=1 Tax=Amblyomma americanum TaxID=6943 RepID=A0A0C9S478_AMBAM
MNCLTSLTLLALISGTLLLVAAAHTGREHQSLYLNMSYFTETQCKLPENGQCEYTDACFCYPPFGSGRIRTKSYFYSPQHKKCIRASNGIGLGCNSFEDPNECFKQCARKLNKGNYKVQNVNRN